MCTAVNWLVGTNRKIDAECRCAIASKHVLGPPVRSNADRPILDNLK